MKKPEIVQSKKKRLMANYKRKEAREYISEKPVSDALVDRHTQTDTKNLFMELSSENTDRVKMLIDAGAEVNEQIMLKLISKNIKGNPYEYRRPFD